MKNHLFILNGLLLMIIFTVPVSFGFMNYDEIYIGFPFEWINIVVSAEGDVSIQFMGKLEKPFVDIYELGIINDLELKYITLCFNVNKPVSLVISHDTLRISGEEAEHRAKSYADKIARWYFNSEAVLEDKRSYSGVMPRSGYRYSFVISLFTLKDVSYDEAIDLFMKCRPSEGFATAITRKFILGGAYFSMTIKRDRKSGALTFEYNIFRTFRGVFKFKPGNTYVLDLFDLLNLTRPFKANSNSPCSVIRIEFQLGGFIDYEFLDIYFSGLPWNIGRGKSEGVLTSYIITNRFYERNMENPPYYIPGKVIDGIRVKFRVVERGFRFPSLSANILGFILLIFVVALIAGLYFIVLRRKL